MSDLLDTVIPLVLLLLIVYIAIELLTGSRKLADIPTLGHSDFLGSCWDAISHFSKNDKIVRQAYKKYKGGLFKISLPNAWNVVVASPDLLEDIRRAPETELSFFFGFAEAFTSELVKDMDPKDHKFADFHVQAIHHGLTRSVESKFPELLDELDVFFDEICPSNGPNEWTAVFAQETVFKLLMRLNNRYFLGLPVCRNPRYLALAKEFIISAVVSGLICQYAPAFLRPIVRYFYSPMTTTTRRVLKYTAPIIEERMRMEEDLGPEWKHRKPNDLVTWLLEEAPPQQRTPFRITQRIMLTNVASSTSLGSSITHGLYQLAANMPQFIEPLREEAERVIGQSGWSKASLDSMKLMESFGRENMRYHGAGVLTMNRKVVKPGGFTFRNGVTLPEGTMVSAAEQGFHYDSAFHKNPEEFDPYRFLNKDDPEAMPRRMDTPDQSFLIWGLGRHACPGRFYGAVLIKLIFAYIFLNFDFKLENEDGRKPPQHLILGVFFMPNSYAKLKFRRRRKTAEKST